MGTSRTNHSDWADAAKALEKKPKYEVSFLKLTKEMGEKQKKLTKLTEKSGTLF